MLKSLFAVLTIVAMALSAIPPAFADDPSNPFSETKEDYSLSISMLSDGTYKVNWWGKLKPDFKFDDLKTFEAVYQTDPNDVPKELLSGTDDLDNFRILPWYYISGTSGQNSWFELLPIVAQCNLMLPSKKISSIFQGQTFMCQHNGSTQGGAGATKSQMMHELKTDLLKSSDYIEVHLQAADGQKSPGVSFDIMVANGDAMADEDEDGIYDKFDNCSKFANPDQADADKDGIGDVCELNIVRRTPLGADSDSDGIEDDADKCPGTVEGDAVDADGCSAADLAQLSASDTGVDSSSDGFEVNQLEAGEGAGPGCSLVQ